MVKFGKKIVQNMFGLDWRSLALLRIGLAIVILCDLYATGGDLRSLYSDEGALPRSALTASTNPYLSLHLLSGSVWFECALFALEGVFALMLLAGYHTRLATVACWLLLLARQARNPLVLFGADMTLRATLFWAMFLPLNRRFSLDVAQGRVRPPETPVYLGVAGVGAIIQFMLIYIISAFLKTGPTWHVDHTAVYYALSMEMYGRPLGQWLNQFDSLTAFLTILTLYLEFFGPLLFILPFFSGWGRLAGFAIFAILQFSFGISMQMGLFWVVMIVAMFLLLPAEFWNYFANPLGRWLQAKWNKMRLARTFNERIDLWRHQRQLHCLLAKNRPMPVALRWPWLSLSFRCLRDGVLLFLIGFVVLYNIDTIPGHELLVPSKLYWVASWTGLDQDFNMFAPDPSTDDGWFVLRGWLKNGKSVNMDTGASPADFTKPANVAASYRDERWSGYLGNLVYSDFENYREPFAQYLDREWNRTHAGDEKLASLEIIFVHEQSGPNHQKLPQTPETLWSETFN